MFKVKTDTKDYGDFETLEAAITRAVDVAVSDENGGWPADIYEDGELVEFGPPIPNSGRR